jgi:hypothetical protein
MQVPALSSAVKLRRHDNLLELVVDSILRALQLFQEQVTAGGAVRFVPFTAISDEPYSTYVGSRVDGVTLALFRQLAEQY